MIIKFLDQIYCQVIPKTDIQLIKSCLEYPAEHWKQGPFRMVKKTRTACLCDQRSGRFLAGLYPRVVKYCRDNAIVADTQPLLDTLRAGKPSLPGIDLREDQYVLLQKVDQYKRGLLVAPPGIGKTVLAGAIISQYPKSKAVMVTHTNSLFTQTIENFQRWFGEENVGVIGDSIYQPNRVNVVMSKTAFSICARDEDGKYPNEKYKGFFDLLASTDVLIIDEAHHCGQLKGSYSDIFERCLATIRIGLTATPVQKKKEALVCEGFLGPIIGQLTIQEGMEKGLLAVPKVKLIPVPLNTAIGEYKSYRDIYKHGIIMNKARNRLIVKEAEERVANGETVLIMITDVVHEQGIMLQEMGRDIYDLDIELVQGSTETETRERIKKALQSKQARCVIATTIWREGVNIPSLDCVIWASGGKSDIATLQGLGRGLRTTDEKKTFTIVDFLDPYKYLSGHTIQRLRVYVENGCL